MDANAITPTEVVSASKKLGKQEAAEMAEAATRLIVAKGKRVSEYKAEDKDSAEAIEAMLGPTGNLRAPTLKAGKTLLVGFNEEVYAASLL